MKAIHLKQNWKGSFTYLEGYEDDEKFTVVEFSMEINLTDNSFTGFSTDAESRKIFKQPASVKGFINKDIISFIMKYPCVYFKDEKGIIHLDHLSEHPDIHYLGVLDSSRNFMKGKWEMTVYEEQYLDGFIEEFSNGDFEMKRIK